MLYTLWKCICYTEKCSYNIHKDHKLYENEEYSYPEPWLSFYRMAEFSFCMAVFISIIVCIFFWNTLILQVHPQKIITRV